MSSTPRRLRRFEARLEVSRAQSTTLPPGERENLQAAARDNLFARPNTPGYALERICPEGVETSVEAITDFYIAVNGHAAELAGNRDPVQFREILRNVRPLTNEDLGRLDHQAPAETARFYRAHLAAIARRAPEVLAELLSELAPLVGKTLEGIPASPAQLQDSFAASAKEFAEVATAIVEAGADGQYTPAELERIVREAHEQREAAGKVEASALALLLKKDRQ